MKNYLLTILIFISALNIASAADNADSTKAEVKNTIKPIVKVFGNYHYSIEDLPAACGFEIQRAYLGFKYELDRNWSARAYLDFGNPKNKSEYESSAYLKEASLTYKNGNFSVDFGQIGLLLFKEQEKIWAHRYIMKPFIDQYKLGPSADLGANLYYKINKMISIDATIRNGEGFKKLQSDNTYFGGFGLTLKPYKGLIIREYLDFAQTSEYQLTLCNFIGYSIPEKFLIGVEYNLQQNNKYVVDKDMSGLSGYATYYLTKKIGVFGRYDFVTSSQLPNTTANWNLAADGSAIVGGIEYFPIDKIKLSLNYQNWMPDDSKLDMSQFIYFNLEYEF